MAPRRLRARQSRHHPDEQRLTGSAVCGFLCTLRKNRSIPAVLPERVQTECAGCGFLVHALQKPPDFRRFPRACARRTHRMRFSCTRSAKRSILSGHFRLQASFGGYLVRGAPDPNHQTDAIVPAAACPVAASLPNIAPAYPQSVCT
jgi:hypothetical protein